MQGAAGVGLSAAGLASLAGCGGQSMPAIPAASDPPLETPALRLSSIPAVCLAPQYVAEELLRAEGFTDIQYVGQNLGIDALLSGAVDLTMLDLGSAIGQL